MSLRNIIVSSRRYFSTTLPDPCNILAIETSCDDSSVCIVSFSPNHRYNHDILYYKTIHQEDLLEKYGGVYPFKAAERHRSTLPLILNSCSHIPIHVIAATRGPGLSSCLAVGWNAAKSLSSWLNIPLFPINHMEGHALVARAFFKELFLPFFALLISGGHTMLVHVDKKNSLDNLNSLLTYSYNIIGNTLDDAIGEAFDKGARMLGLSPTGEALSKFAENGDSTMFSFSLPFKHQSKTRSDFSFSGLKTELSRHIKALTDSNSNLNNLADLAASYQDALIRHVVDRVQFSIIPKYGPFIPLIVSGGVARNIALKKALSKQFQKLLVPPKEYCVDNAFMIAWVCMEKLWNNALNDYDHKSMLQVDIDPLWSLKLDQSCFISPSIDNKIL